MNTAHNKASNGLGILLAAIVVILAAISFTTDSHAQTGSINGTVTGTTTDPESGISGVTVSGGADGTAHIQWKTEHPSTSWVSYGILGAPYTSVTPVDVTLTTDHAVTITGLTTDTAYHYSVSSRSASGDTVSSLDRAFVIVAVTNSGNATSTDTGTSTANSDQALTDRIASLEAEVSSLRSQLSNLWLQFQAFIASVGAGGSNSGGSGSGNNGTSTGSTSASGAYVTANSSSVRLGTSVDFMGHGFWADEPVTVMSNGSTVATAHADSMGNFSTGSMPIQSTQGSQAFSFRGSWSGLTATGMVNVTQ